MCPFRLTRPKRAPGRRRGAALVTMLGLLFLFSVAGAGVMALVNNSLRMAERRTDMTEAFNMADAGLDLGIAWLSQQAVPPDDRSLHPLTDFFGTNGTISRPFGDPGTTLTVRIDGDATNAGPVQKHYLIESRAQMPSGAVQVARAYVQQTSFGKYAFFTVNDGGGFWDYNNHFEGPFHSNDADGRQTRFLWKANNTSDPIFTYTGDDAFSVSGNVIWWKNSIGATVAPSSITDYRSIAAGGQATMTTGYKTDANGNYLLDGSGRKIPNSPQIPLPGTDYQQQYAALGIVAPAPCTSPPPGAPTTPGVTVTPGGGIYIHGDNQMALAVDAAGNQQIVVTQGSTVQTVTLNAASGSTTVLTKVGANPATTQIVGGLPNGMVYSDGNITSLKGTVADNTVDGGGNITHRSQMTIATDIAAGKDVTLSDSVKYKTGRDLSKKQTDDSAYNLNAGTLGILSRNVVVKDGAPVTLEFDGSIFATGTFKAANSGNPPGSANATMTSIGGVIVHDAGIFAAANADGSLRSGYQEQYHYDNRLADHPPPFFPTTGNHYDLLSWQRANAML